MEIKGKLIKKLDTEKGTTKAGKEWQKHSFIFEQDDKFNTEICVNVFGDLTKDIKLKLFQDLVIGEEYKVYVNISSKEFNGKYYTNINGWNVVPLGLADAVNMVDKNNKNKVDLPF
jgi:hypothetical protein